MQKINDKATDIFADMCWTKKEMIIAANLLERGYSKKEIYELISDEREATDFENNLMDRAANDND